MLTRRRLVLFCLFSALVLMVGTAVLGAAGVLKSTKRGDVTYVQTDTSPTVAQ